MSVDPPGGYTTTILILPAGQFWAWAVNGTTSAPRSRYRLESMRMNMLPEKLHLCRNDGFEAGPVVNRGRQCSTLRFYGPCLLHLSEAAHDRFGHSCDIARSQIEVRFRCKSGHTADTTAMTGFDPGCVKTHTSAKCRKYNS